MEQEKVGNNQEQLQVKKKKSPVRIIVLVIVLLAAGFFGFKKISYAINHETTDNAQVETQLVPVLPRVSGYIKSINVNDFDSVHTNQLLVEMDDEELQTQLVQMEADYQTAIADVANAKAALNNAQVSLSVNRGNIDINQVKLKKAEADYNRNKNLFAESAITQRQLEDSRYDFETYQKQVENSVNDLTTAQSRMDVLRAGVERAQANLKSKEAQIAQQKLKISYTKIYAPQAGKLGKKNISLGQFVQAGSPLFTIVGDTTYWVVANFKESQIKKLHAGMPVNIELDAYPNLEIQGNIESVSDATGARFALLPPDNASGNFVKVTQRVPVKISIQKAGSYRDTLRAGLSVFVSVPLYQ
jgi:membrane fusion protein (multidrug efflux system)